MTTNEQLELGFNRKRKPASSAANAKRAWREDNGGSPKCARRQQRDGLAGAGQPRSEQIWMPGCEPRSEGVSFPSPRVCAARCCARLFAHNSMTVRAQIHG